MCHWDENLPRFSGSITREKGALHETSHSARRVRRRPHPRNRRAAGAHEPRVRARRLHHAQKHREAARRTENADRCARRADRGSQPPREKRRAATPVRERHRDPQQPPVDRRGRVRRLARHPHRSRRRRLVEALRGSARTDLHAVDQPGSRTDREGGTLQAAERTAASRRHAASSAGARERSRHLRRRRSRSARVALCVRGRPARRRRRHLRHHRKRRERRDSARLGQPR